MTFKPPTYEQYKKATEFARFRYKWSLLFIVTAWLFILISLVYIIKYTDELTTNPLVYSAKKYNVNCYCFDPEGNTIFFNNETISYAPPLIPKEFNIVMPS